MCLLPKVSGSSPDMNHFVLCDSLSGGVTPPDMNHFVLCDLLPQVGGRSPDMNHFVLCDCYLR